MLITEGFTSSFLTAESRNETVLTRIEFYISGQVCASMIFNRTVYYLRIVKVILYCSLYGEWGPFQDHQDKELPIQHRLLFSPYKSTEATVNTLLRYNSNKDLKHEAVHICIIHTCNFAGGKEGTLALERNLLIIASTLGFS